ncbi:hypothetical protein [Microvirga roseola]|uniref:hypothetical protein n=1 Tax=Microvirga roseola TaxID=2883126 RepID=UPI001E43B3EF|nr:hypothetical protein [Microvirga roseola]
MHEPNIADTRIHIDAGRTRRDAPEACSALFPEATLAEALVNPGGIFRDPHKVAEHPSFSPEEKRIILLSWARDELVVEQVASGALPELRRKSKGEAVIEALSHFDALAAAEYRAVLTSIRGLVPGAGSWMRMAPSEHQSSVIRGGETCRSA